MSSAYKPPQSLLLKTIIGRLLVCKIVSFLVFALCCRHLAKHLKSFFSFCGDLFTFSMANQQIAQKNDLLSLIGKLAFRCKVVKPGRIFFSTLSIFQWQCMILIIMYLFAVRLWSFIDGTSLFLNGIESHLFPIIVIWWNYDMSLTRLRRFIQQN